ncbi:uncharacterized protein Dwil_GK22755 [Drosophila willistoni]|uniref:Uncharacterized protein n=2 Tax=Drosophila willistoni TaxID=7260 RepID=B4NG25_DROWI|nr:uncharacterized protein Dwil_GK22755 [Drosophila willistoni]
MVSVDGKPRPTFDKIADILDVLIDDGSQYARPGPRPYASTGPLIQEGYQHGYDYNYGSGHGYGSGIGYAQPPVQGGYNYYPPPRPVHEVRPSPGYHVEPHYPHRQPEPYGYSNSRDYSYGYGSGSSGGYKSRGY